MSREPLETMPEVMDAKQLAEALRIGGRKLVMKHDLLEWLRSHTNGKG